MDRDDEYVELAVTVAKYVVETPFAFLLVSQIWIEGGSVEPSAELMTRGARSR